MIASSGAKLLKEEAIDTLKRHLLPICTLVTPNMSEAGILLNQEITSLDMIRFAAREIFETYGCPTLVKGGHLPRSHQAIDVFYDGREIYEFKKRYVRGVNSHGSGCTYAAAITAYLAKGKEPLKAIEMAKNYVQRAFEKAIALGDVKYLNHFWRRA